MYKKIFVKIIFAVLILSISIMYINNLYAFNRFSVDKAGVTNSAASVASVDNAVAKVWNTVVTIIQVLAVAAIVITGVRYMLANADQKADVKKQTMWLIIGAILVFGASGVIKLLISASNQITSSSSMITNNDGSVERYSDYDGDGINDWDDTGIKGNGPDIISGDGMRGKAAEYYRKWVAEHPDDPNYK